MAGRIRGNPPQLNARMAAVLKQAPTANDIMKDMDLFNEEITDQLEAKGIEHVPLTTETLAGAVGQSYDDIPENGTYPETKIESVFKFDEQEPEVAEETLEQVNARLDAQIAAQNARRAEEAEAASEAPVQEVEPEMDIQQQVLKLLKDRKGSPSQAQIAAWKAKAGEDGVQVLAMGKSDVYVFTYLTYSNFQQIQAAVAKQAQIDGMGADPEKFMMEHVLKSCVLWPKLSVEFFYQSRSGVIPTLYSSVMLHSYHLTPQQAMVLTAQL
jgi:hypothetical protein